jgi:hypothetical protein
MEDQILHDVAKVLRGSLHAVVISKDFYPSPSDLSNHRSLQFFPPSLMTFLSWLIDDNYFHIESDYNALRNIMKNLIFLHIRTSTKEASTSENMRSAFNLLVARIASATDIELLKTIFD